MSTPRRCAVTAMMGRGRRSARPLRSLSRGRVKAARSGVAHRPSPAAKRTMSSVPLPSESEEQAPDHQRYALLDMSAEEPFDALTRLARQLADTPMAFISI